MAQPESSLERGRRLFADQAWAGAQTALNEEDQSNGLAVEDLELLATATYMIGRDEEYFRLLERAYTIHLERDRSAAALRCAFWIGINLMLRGESGRAGGWMGRARKLLGEQQGETVESGYLMLPLVFQREASGDLASAATAASEAVTIAERFGDAELFCLAAQAQGHLLIQSGRIGQGLSLLDQAMVTVASGELSPIVVGIVYCAVILACQEAQDLRRAREWTGRLSEWCQGQPEIVAFTGRCLIHRAEIMQLDGSPEEALREARRAAERCDGGGNRSAAAEARYREGEIHRQLGDLISAERAFRLASRGGRDPQPGFALLRLAQGDREAAAAAILRASAEASVPARQAELLPACVEIMLATGRIEAAEEACEQLDRLASGKKGGPFQARAAQSRGAVRLARGDARGALKSLRTSERTWQDLDCPYETARVRELVGLACSSLGDNDTAALETEAARKTYERIGARTDLNRICKTLSPSPGEPDAALTRRELQVLRLISDGSTNRAIANELVISERTVERHASNIFDKLGVSSRAAATAFAYQHGLI